MDHNSAAKCISVPTITVSLLDKGEDNIQIDYVLNLKKQKFQSVWGQICIQRKKEIKCLVVTKCQIRLTYSFFNV